LCAQAATLDPSFAPGFFYYGFDWVKVGDGHAFATGYYEPEIEGSRTPQPGYVPIYRVPPDLVRCTKADGTNGRGRIDETGACVLYYTRAEIEDGALNGKGLELAWAKDPIDLFFLEIQGSGRIRLDDGTVMRVGYAGQNGRDYIAIGRLLRDRGILPPGGASMQAIKDWIRANPDQGKELMRENLSYVFFKELTGQGPLGALNVPVTPHVTVAADPNYVPLGAPIYLAKADRPEVDGLWVAQDTGGAIKGPNRFDTFWGAGPEAVATAGGMSASGEALILIPKGVASRALARKPSASTVRTTPPRIARSNGSMGHLDTGQHQNVPATPVGVKCTPGVCVCASDGTRPIAITSADAACTNPSAMRSTVVAVARACARSARSSHGPAIGIHRN
jgi:membrane-bound lytic murein transglycosylase A